MRIDTIEACGILRFRDPLAVDLRQLPAGLIAIVGPNGSGKTSFCEAVTGTLYRTFPSRPDKGIVDYAHDRQSVLQVRFTLGEDSYRARLHLDAGRRASEGVVVRETPAGDVVLTDGKVSSYDEVLTRLVPPQTLTLASVFAVQTRAGSFARLDRKSRRQLFADLIGLDHYARMASTAKAAAGIYAAALERVQWRLQRLRDASSLGTSEALHAALVDADAQLAALADQVSEATETHRVARARGQVSRQALTAAQQALAEAVATQARRGDLTAQSIASSGRVVAVRAEVAGEREAQERAFKAQQADLARRRENNAQVLADAVAIRAAVDRVDAIQQRDRPAAAARLTAAQESALVAAQQVAVLDQLCRVAETQQRDLAQAESTVSLLTTVPCGGVSPYASCGFLGGAMAAQAALPDLRVSVRSAAQVFDEREAARAASTVAEETLRACSRELTSLDGEAQALAPRLRLSDALARAEARLSELDAQQAQIDIDHQRSIEALDARLHAALEREAETSRAIVAALDALPSLDVFESRATSVQACQAQLVSDDAAVDAASARVAMLTAHHATVAADRRLLAERLSAAQARDAEVAAWLPLEARLHAEDVAWRRLSEVFGPEGIPTLEIDAAGPTVSALANDLLHVCYGGRFSLELVTQEPKASGKGTKETFELKVFDQLSGGAPRDLTDLSGGEQVVVEEALKCALALFMAQKSPTPWRTCFRDETTGPLDAANAAQYVPLLRRVRELGRFHQVLYVTHHPDAARLADAQLRFNDGTVTVALPPY